MKKPVTLFFLPVLGVLCLFSEVASAQAGPCDAPMSDTTAPVINCPADTLIQLDPWACEISFSFSVSVSDNCDPEPLLVQTDTTGLSTGDFFYVGEYLLTFVAEDASGNVSSCSFIVQIAEVEDGIIQCQDNLVFSIGEDGLLQLTADMLLEGGPYGCIDDYDIVVQGSNWEGVLSEDGLLGCEHVSELLRTAKVTDTESGNMCWVSFYLIDDLPPVFDCVQDTLSLACDLPLSAVPPPLASDNCTDVDVVLLLEEVVDDDMCDGDSTMLVRRLWVASDTFGNFSDTCEQYIRIFQPDIVFPVDIVWSCEQVAAFPTLLEGVEVHDAILLLGGDPLDASHLTDTAVLANSGSGYARRGYVYQENSCLVGISYQDTLLPGGCDYVYRIQRVWTAVNWCYYPAEGSIQMDTQYIYVVDEKAPLLSLDSFSVSANVLAADTLPCRFWGHLPPPVVDENCHDYSIRIYTPLGEADYVNGVDGAEGGMLPLPGLPQGSYELLYEVEDACGNLAQLTVPFSVVDDIAPTASCQQSFVQVLPDGFPQQITAGQLNDSSADNCCMDYLEVRRANGDCYGNEDDFGPDVTVCCTDVNSGPVEVVLRAYDCSGNYSDCTVWVEVQVIEDGALPVVTNCPQSLTISCDEYLNQVYGLLSVGDESILDSLYGTASFLDNCDLEISYVWSEDINTCTEGTIVRTWTAVDGNNIPVVCEQLITIEHVEDYQVIFPPDSLFVCSGGVLPDFGEPIILGDGCELIGVSYSDEVFHVVPDACYKIVRNWTVINWCTYPDGLQYEAAQVIRVVDEEPPLFSVSDLSFCVDSFGCSVDVLLPAPEVMDCSSDVVIEVLSPGLSSYADADNPYLFHDVPAGIYSVSYIATDGCENTTSQQFEVTIADCQAPTALCHSIVADVGQLGFVGVSAWQLDAGSTDNCSSHGNLQFSFSQDVGYSNHTYFCEDLFFAGGDVSADLPVELWVTDEWGNQSFCETTIQLVDPFGACELIPVILGGNIFTEFSLGVPDVLVNVNDGFLSTYTDGTGAYVLSVLLGGSYTLRPLLDENPLQGVSTLDLVLLSRHILNVDPLDSPYKLIAADVNRSNTISTLDLVELQKLILGIYESFPNNTSWRFVDAAYVFPDPADPWAGGGFPEEIMVANAYDDMDNLDFIAVKIGDLNNSVNFYTGAEVLEQHQLEAVVLHADDLYFNEGEHLRCTLRVQQDDFSGMQWTLRYDASALAFRDWQSDFGASASLGFRQISEGVLGLSWPVVPSLSLNDEAVFVLEFEALKAGSLHSCLALEDHPLRSEAYAGREPVAFPLRLSFGESPEEPLLYGMPNPFHVRTVIGFYLPEGSPVRLSVWNAEGLLIRQTEGEYEAGWHEWILEIPEIRGVLLCRLQTPGGARYVKLLSQ